MKDTNPLFGRKSWSYVTVIRGPVRGPQPRLAQGTGQTGKKAATGTGAQLPSYVSDNSYRPSPFSYMPSRVDAFTANIPRSISTGNDGREMVGTYQPHDFIPAQRFFHQMRSVPNWQVQAFPESYRNIIQHQQAMIYRPQSHTISARILSRSNYFLGYQIQEEVQGQVGQNTLGYMGSM